MKNRYEDLLEYYDELFPVEKKRMEFIEFLTKNLDPSRPFRVLDIGCATGTTALYLARQGMDLVGIDVNETMIQSANRRNREPKSNARFFCMDMRACRSYFPAASFDMILCLGNSLACLNSKGEIDSLFRQVRELLVQDGVFVFELLNYDRIVVGKSGEIPPKETVRVNLTQRYNTIPDGHIRLSTAVLSLNGYPVFSEDTLLYPVGSRELSSLLRNAPLSGEPFYRDFDKNPLSREAVTLVGTARKD
ncbi:putative methyltransferase type 11 [Treponema primitia ZAS-2]|uniref:Putative methyltransferase type 11 n=1 Tax=Treponema primitia (strain ATCC BAA-887 / DSM 12427 / ZAS-2) TaxID=545694 RepID=F5YNH2_TREPZ|nr:methyltransferase domain-containing protein [Treponema primitia]AEF84223.1 putative methyltransferase type 11 [Treponema primitia ZAS-2]